jgi:hypothetical protein
LEAHPGGEPGTRRLVFRPQKASSRAEQETVGLCASTWKVIFGWQEGMRDQPGRFSLTFTVARTRRAGLLLPSGRHLRMQQGREWKAGADRASPFGSRERLPDNPLELPMASRRLELVISGSPPGSDERLVQFGRAGPLA